MATYEMAMALKVATYEKSKAYINNFNMSLAILEFKEINGQLP